MSERKYVDLLTVKVGESLKVARAGGGIADEGSLVNLDNGESGIVVATMFCEDGGDKYSFVANLVPIHEITAAYRCNWSREDPNEPS